MSKKLRQEILAKFIAEKKTKLYHVKTNLSNQLNGLEYAERDLKESTAQKAVYEKRILENFEKQYALKADKHYKTALEAVKKMPFDAYLLRQELDRVTASYNEHAKQVDRRQKQVDEINQEIEKSLDELVPLILAGEASNVG
jgi:hypothetical protein